MSLEDNQANSQTEPRRLFAPIQHMLLATKSDKSSVLVLERAALLSATLGAKATVVHVIDPDLGTFDRQYREAKLRRRVRTIFSEEQNQPEILVTPHDYHVDDPVFARTDNILRVVREQKADLILVGHSKAPPLFRAIRGTVATQAIASGDAPLLICTSQELAQYKNVIIATDLAGGHALKVRTALDLAPKARFEIVYVRRGALLRKTPHEATFPTPEMARDKFLDGINCQNTRAKMAQKFNDGTATITIDATASADIIFRQRIEDKQPDLMVFATRVHLGFERLILGSFAQKYINRPPCDILAVRKFY